jgi:hypothetical protein
LFGTGLSGSQILEHSPFSVAVHHPHDVRPVGGTAKYYA